MNRILHTKVVVIDLVCEVALEIRVIRNINNLSALHPELLNDSTTIYYCSQIIPS